MSRATARGAPCLGPVPVLDRLRAHAPLVAAVGATLVIAALQRTTATTPAPRHATPSPPDPEVAAAWIVGTIEGQLWAVVDRLRPRVDLNELFGAPDGCTGVVLSSLDSIRPCSRFELLDGPDRDAF